ncbi:hypothetical protein KAFR_0C02330 [Kazachstania africana CBS 2517]|uniref:Uncharacterized protein n=1 Tax=Kazachstania africana (strain ATCC 22294 / BCRC 22015 / CBS 2517 / CECT 1963 / NBRC 1671 / NRRL Y-8276) TaxID=1071382 RepID=H2AS76_KAZAF|nr:hypothetical protein KAFR_0C02330 [Kazachstania africana CBS 2517]CCF57226.1 hypothetical protein KAFR_0C02330 [Kazachstania africana CBS 2517]
MSEANRYTQVLIAQYLKQNGFEDTLSNFLRESSLPLTSVRSKLQDLHLEDLETIVGDRIQFGDNAITGSLNGLVLNDALPAIDEGKYGIGSWNHISKFVKAGASVTDGLAISTKFDKFGNIMFSMSNKRIQVYDSNLQYKQDFKPVAEYKSISKYCGPIGDSDYYYSCSIDGTLSIYDKTFAVLPKCDAKVHEKMITHIVFIKISSTSYYVVSSGLENILKITLLTFKDGSVTFEELSNCKLLSACTSCQVGIQKFGRNNDSTSRPFIFVTRAQFTHVLCYTLSAENKLYLHCNIALNIAQFSTYSFEVRDMVLMNLKSPECSSILSENSVLVVATSHVPYLRLIIVELPMALLEGEGIGKGCATSYGGVLKDMATTIPQNSFSQPILKFIPNCNGFIIGGDQAIYGIDISSGDSWELALSGYTNMQRIKAIDVNLNTSQIVVGAANKMIYSWKVRNE